MGIALSTVTVQAGFREPAFSARVSNQENEPKEIKRADLGKFVPDQAKFLKLLAGGISHRRRGIGTGSVLFTRAAEIIDLAAVREHEINVDGHSSDFSLLDRDRQFAFAAKNTLGITNIIVSSIPNAQLGVYKVVIHTIDKKNKMRSIGCRVDLLDEVKLQQFLTKMSLVL